MIQLTIDNPLDSLLPLSSLIVASDALEVKRQMESGGRRIRVMTIHGAKGLEAPIVILPDMAKRRVDLRNEILIHEDHVFWKTKVDSMPSALKAAHEAALLGDLENPSGGMRHCYS